MRPRQLRKLYEDSMLLISSTTSTSHLVLGLGVDLLLIINRILSVVSGFSRASPQDCIVGV